MKLKELASYLDSAVPLSFQEDYDNSGLQVGQPGKEVTSALISLDVTGQVIDEAIAAGCDVIIAHHPLIFHPIKRLTDFSENERIIVKAIKKDIAIYSAHTNLDMFSGGVSKKMAEILKLKDTRVLTPMKGKLLKLVVYIPEASLDKVRKAVFDAGAGVAGNYDSCGYVVSGTGSFRGNETTNPFVGEKGKLHFEKEARFETILFSHLKDKVVKAMIEAHPYEEVAYDLYSVENINTDTGLGRVGRLPVPVSVNEFLKLVSKKFSVRGLRYSGRVNRKISVVALCGGAGGQMIKDAIGIGADAFVSADIRYHSFFEAEEKILIVDIGHYESEKPSVEILYDLIIKKFPTFAVRFSEINTNPINYFKDGKSKNT